MMKSKTLFNDWKNNPFQKEVITSIAKFIDHQLLLNKGVKVTGLGTFTFIQRKLDVGGRKFTLTHKPVFILDERLSKTHHLKENIPYLTGQIRVVPLNYSEISAASENTNRDQVKRTISYITINCARHIAADLDFNLDLSPVGSLSILDKHVNFTFLNNYPPKLPALRCRPSTSLAKPLAAHTQKEVTDTNFVGKDCDFCDVRSKSSAKFLQFLEPQKSLDPICEANTNNNQCAAVVDIVCVDELQKQLNCTEDDHPKLLPLRETEEKQDDKNNEDSPNAPEVACLELPCTHTTNQTEDKAQHKVPDVDCAESDSGVSPVAGEDDELAAAAASRRLCFLCQKREDWNQVMSLSSERRARLKEESIKRREIAKAKDEKVMRVRQEREENILCRNKEVSAYNYKVSEDQRKLQQTKDQAFYPSYIFYERPPTPSVFLNRLLLSREQKIQAEQQRARKCQQRQDDREKERKRSEKIMEELTSLRKHHQQLLKQRRDSLRFTLDQQIQLKESDKNTMCSPVTNCFFGPSECEKLKISRRFKAQKLAEYHLEMIERKQKEAKERREKQIEREREAVKRALDDLEREKVWCEQIKAYNLQNLKEQWHEEEERKLNTVEFPRQSFGEPVTDRAKNYPRCYRCQRRFASLKEQHKTQLEKQTVPTGLNIIV